MNGVVFVPNLLGQAEAAAAPGMEAAARAAATVIAAKAIALAPFDPEDPDEHYREQIEVDSGIVGGVAFGRVNANDPASGYIEFGTSDTPTFAVLRRAGEMGAW